jgi:hypothetical protein
VPTTSVDVPLESPAYFGLPFVYLGRHEYPIHDAGFLYYLQKVRTGGLGRDPDRHECTLGYKAGLSAFAANLAAMTRTLSPSVIFSPPSSRNDAFPYRTAIRAIHPTAIDITTCFTRLPGVSAGDGATVPEIEEAISFTPPRQLPRDGSIAVIDDVFRSGKTFTAILNHLARNGISTERAVLICPLWLQPQRHLPLPTARPA